MTTIQSATAETLPHEGPALSYKLWCAVFPYLLVLPTFLAIFTFTLWPSVSAVIQSTFKPGVTVRIAPRFVGIGNYADLFDSSRDVGQRFPTILVNTLEYVAVTVPVSMALAFTLALLLNRKIRALTFFRFAFFYPVLMPTIGAGSVFAFIFANNVGLANTVLRSVSLPTIHWIGDPFWSLVSIMLVAVWKQTGFYMIIYLAGMQNLPQDVYEASDLDGATGWRKNRGITRPPLGGTTVFIPLA